MLLTIISVFVGYFVGKGKRGTRVYKMLGIVLGMAFFLGLIFSFIEQFQIIILPVGTSELINYWRGPEWFYHPLWEKIAVLEIVTLSLTFFWFLVGRFSKWLISRRGL